MYSATYPRSGRRAPLQPAAVRQLPCSSDPDLFFADAPEDVRRAKALCAACPIRLACLAGALERGEPHGVWGGALFLHGTIVAGKRPRGRPRKSPAARPVVRRQVMACGGARG
jgi:WhiB family transcriptional regulator, redox-sensing transcriptional regulator